MSCKNIHQELVDLEEVTCPFCNEVIGEHTIIKETCCSEQIVENHGNMNVCIKCGSVQGYKYVNEYIDFYENKHKIRRKSVYQRKYHIEKIINNLCQNNGIQISHKDRDKIFKIFKEIGSVIHLVNNDRKRMINLNFIFKQIFLMLDLPNDKIKITKSKKTLQKYNQYWVDILLLKFDTIIKII